MTKKSFPLIVLSFHLIVFAGCGYTTGSALSSHLKTVYVQPLKNKINYSVSNNRNVYFPLLEVNVRNEVIDRFQFDGNLKIVKEDEADLVLKGSLDRYERGALRYTDSDDVQEYRVHVIVTLELWDTKNSALVWREEGFAGQGTYYISGPQLGTEENAVKEAIEDLARRIVERTIENW